jgi:tetratricopeptide (TPR) repeat protein
MVRYAILGAIGAGALVLVGPLLTGKADPADKAIQTQLAIQQAMEQAKQLCAKGDHAKAVDVLEEQLPRINGNPVYLDLLRDAYRAHIRALLVQQQLPLAEKYRERLKIIDRTADNDPALRPAAESKPAAPLSNPLAKLAAGTEYYPRSAKDTNDAKPNAPGGPVVRAKNEDPFDFSNRLAPDNANRQSLAKTLLSQAEAAYMAARFVQARLYYEQASQADPSCVVGSKERWAYCKLIYAVDQLNQKGVDAAALGNLQREVETAITMFPALKDHAAPALAKIEGLARNPAATDNRSTDRSYTVQHKGANAQGWHVTETTNFVIIHKQPKEMVEKVANVAEKTRFEMFQKWFGGATAWSAKCEIRLHPTGLDYARATGISAATAGHARIETDGKLGRVVARRVEVHVDHPDMLEVVLPHETTHVVLAGQFGSAAVPRWADEGMAVLTEPADKIEQRRRDLVRGQRDGTLLKIKDLMTLQDWPQPRHMTAFYAQSVLLVEMLLKEKGPQAFTAFLRDGVKDGYEAALRKHYTSDFNGLQASWARHMTAEVNRMSALMAGR